MDIIKELEQKMASLIEFVRQEMMGVRSNRPSPRLVEDIAVEVYGQRMTVRQVGAISIQPPASIIISVWDKGAVNVVAKAIESSSLNVVANVDGMTIRINLPALTDERRKEIIKMVKKEIEEAKIKVRSLRDDENKRVAREADEGNFTEDEKFKLKEQIQAVVDRGNKELDQLLEKKTAEIMEQ
ncbi:ribosome recycling factor [Candidatus Wolfebacteria bacterium RIFOXYD12_FULL_48_21]|uniref:Ribosome recycling factor n=1 Tax=Candidatus Wolfebacteria bacterium RIFOXYD1_FULL_48_65 TaxID=1802561 RepID=A0A1F8E3U3_9BACT|nr:MAG: ribosome recycling factor [Candidatus Wolfebacteria bacterium RIFOXYD12_FULL_48_21]OGM95506.1 MAG: ribosome recycling factor [Candidatus Wolfebacteria bacterium RIFOXYD1_FULL_48_65]OGM97834.1 MAG: ribosome recycling factor [Candidatus Wolfebacteria bacterium RIFOXYD2_FULL_48_11]